MGAIVEKLKSENFHLLLRLDHGIGPDPQLCLICLDSDIAKGRYKRAYTREKDVCLGYCTNPSLIHILNDEMLEMYIMIYPHYQTGIANIEGGKEIAISEVLSAWGSRYNIPGNCWI